ncbi:MAG: ion transporter [Flavobacteriales bacterium]|jgi:voltage-gated potassium channel|nr:ion transporter [Flavobacteriales bacterium]
MNLKTKSKSWRERWHEIIYEADTKEGKLFDIILLILILSSIGVVMLESVESYRETHSNLLNYAEWVITIFFSIEYIMRILVINKPWRYIFSFYGIIDLLSTIPKYLSLFFVGTHVFVAVRALRLLRVFRVLKLVRYVGEANLLMKSLKASKARILVFLMAVFSLSIILGTIMYLIEGPENGFTSIPRSFYWAIVTLTTVGYGDISPHTALGQFIATIVMIMGYGIIAVPTGIVTVEMSKQAQKDIDLNTQSCRSCSAEGHLDEAEYCYSCGEFL